MSMINKTKEISFGLANEFKAFIAKGNVMDLAVGVIIGAAFGKIVDSIVKDVIMPAIGMFAKAPDFSSIAIGAHKAVGSDGKEILTGGIMVGNFLNAVVAFLILAAVVFFCLVKPMNKLMATVKKPAPVVAPPTPEDVLLLREIRDLLQTRQKPPGLD
jgi:large conductance mechanosensitive channel